MSDDYPVLFRVRKSQADAISENFDLTYNEEFIHSMLLDAISEQFREVAKVNDEMARLNVDGLAALMAEEVGRLLHAHLERTVHMSVYLLLTVAHQLAQASLYDLYERCGLLTTDVRAFRPSKTEIMEEPINILLSEWLNGFGVTMRPSGRPPESSSPSQWLQDARAKYAEMKLMKGKVCKGEFGMALGYGKGVDGEQSKESAAKWLREKLKDYGYKWDDITGAPQGEKKKLRKKSNQKSD